MHKRISPDRKEIGDAIHEVTKINPPEGLLWVGCSPSRQAATGQKRSFSKEGEISNMCFFRNRLKPALSVRVGAAHKVRFPSLQEVASL